MMDKTINQKQKNLQLMQQIHSQHLDSAASDVERLRRYLHDYDSLQTTLTALPSKLSHNALVPLGGAALVPGQLVRTNNVLVLLGDNWFVETTALKARGIAARRYQDCEQKLKQAEEAHKLQSHWVDHAAHLQQETGADIVEHLTDDEYKRAVERHREMVKRHRQQLREHNNKSELSEASRPKSVGGENSVSVGDASTMGGDELKEEWLRRLEELEEMEKDELSSDEDSGDIDGSDDSSDSEGDSDSDDDSGEAGEREAGPGGDSDEDSEEDLPANLHTFKHVKIESPMPSAERKFQYSEADTSPEDEEAVGPAADDEVADIAAVGERIRGRTRSFTRTTDRGVARCGSQGRDSSNDSKDDPSESKPYSGQRPPVARRVSWADQSSIVGSEEGISIRYTATPSTSSTTAPSTDSTLSSKPSVTSTESTSSSIKSPDVNLKDNEKSSQPEPEASPVIASPADLVKLATVPAPDAPEKKPTENKEVEAPAPAAVVSTTESSSGPKPKSILKKTASQDVIHVPTTKGTSWLQSAESVPITTMYDHEPIVPTSPSPPLPPQVEAMTYKVVARDPDAGEPALAVATEDSSQAPKRVSKFKAGRQKQ